MNKTLLFVLIGVAILAAVSVFLFSRSGSVDLHGSANNNENITAGESGLFTSAFTGSGSVKCEYTDDLAQGTAYVKDGKVRFTSVNEGQSANIIIVNNIMYMWGVGATEGLVIDTTQAQADGEDAGLNYSSPEEVRAEIESKQPECVNEEIDDAMFDPPTDVNFTDFSQFMQNLPTVPTE